MISVQNVRTFRQLPLLSELRRPIVSIGAGGIVRSAHLPAYRIAGFEVVSIYDPRAESAQELAAEFDIAHVASTLEEAVANAPENAIFDVAVPGAAILDVLAALPAGAYVLIQKPMGVDLEGARAIRDACRAKGMVAAVNFQMRYAPYVQLARSIHESGAIGELLDIEVRLTTDTPWHLWDFLVDIPRMEIVYHSIHYIDTIRSFCGEPSGVYAKTIGHPRMPQIRQSRSAILLDYDTPIRATITSNHTHNFGPEYQESYIKWEGERGAIRAVMGLNLDYPEGRPDAFAVALSDSSGEYTWHDIELEGSWFPHAFIGPMADLMRFSEGAIPALPTGVEDAYRTMAVVEAAYTSSANGGTPVPD